MLVVSNDSYYTNRSMLQTCYITNTPVLNKEPFSVTFVTKKDCLFQKQSSLFYIMQHYLKFKTHMKMMKMTNRAHIIGVTSLPRLAATMQIG